MSNIEGKVWGFTTAIHRGATFEVHRIHVQPGGYCSKHRHDGKYNKFHVEQGSLLVHVWRDNGILDTTTLGAGDSLTIEPGVFHQFEAREYAVALEVYWAECGKHDIYRETVGGVRR